ncbi:hypothetical protein J6590_037693 [Homalodisca vitripennis]|nr:hypothetical protein J6590_037693 [Homalodisca vitripennis]
MRTRAIYISRFDLSPRIGAKVERVNERVDLRSNRRGAGSQFSSTHKNAFHAFTILSKGIKDTVSIRDRLSRPGTKPDYRPRFTWRIILGLTRDGLRPTLWSAVH